MNIQQLTVIVGWCLVINVGLLLYSTIMLIALKGWVTKVHQRLFKLSEEELERAYFQFLAQFKILIIVFNLVPYIAFKLY